MKKLVYTLIFLLILNLIFNIKNCEGQWMQMYGMQNDKYVYSLARGNGNNAHQIFAGTNAGFYKCTDEYSWYQSTLNNKTIRSLVVNGNDVYAGTGYNSGIFRSTNNGIIWSQTGMSGGSIYSLAKSTSSETYIFAGTWLFGVSYSSNNGMNWTQTSSLSAEYVYSLVTNGSTVYAGTNNGIYVFGFPGPWYQIALSSEEVHALAIDGETLFAGTNGYGVYRSTNLGQNWIQTSLDNKNVLSLAISGSNIFAGTLNEGVYHSTNNGANWIQINQGFTTIPTVTALVISKYYLIAGTEGKSAWQRDLEDFGIGIQNISTEIPSKYSLSQNYPNPFNPSTVIRFSLPAVSFASLKIYDMLGKEVATLVNEKLAAGTYSVDWNASEFTSGVYFYKLITDKYTETKRMILMK